MINEWASAFFLVAGSLYMLLSAIGMLRFPDLYTRIHATTKASSLGIMLMLAATSIFFPGLMVFMLSVLIIIITFVTKPLASHAISRAAHIIKVEKWWKTTRDDLEEADKSGIIDK